MNPDFNALLCALRDAEVRFLVVGAYALAFYGHPRATRDLDLWVEATPQNAVRLMSALHAFGAPLEGVDESDFSRPGGVLQIGVAPVRADLLTSLDALAFAEAWDNRESGEMDGLRLNFLSRADYVRNKRAVGRAQDLADIERLRGH